MEEGGPGATGGRRTQRDKARSPSSRRWPFWSWHSCHLSILTNSRFQVWAGLAFLDLLE